MGDQQKRSRHERRREETHQKLLDALREMIVTKGYNNVDILDITEQADVSKATFYKHFNNKEQAVRELMLTGFDALVAEIFSIESENTDDWMFNSFYKLFRWAAENRRLLLIMVGGAASTQLNAFGRSYMVDITERAMLQYSPPSARYTPEIRSQLITGIIIQMLGWWLESDTGHSAHDMATLLNEVLHNALGIESTGPSRPVPLVSTTEE